ncbi:MAG: hypothetical protein ABIH66_02590 [bacterium]
MAYKIRLFLLFVLAALAALPVRAANVEENAEFSKLRGLHREISLLNLVNGLYLRDEQMEQLIEVLRDVETLEDRYRDSLESIVPEMENAYAALHSDLVDDDIVDENVEHRAAQIHQREIELKHSYQENLSKLEKAAEDIFTDKQLAIIDDFQPCLIPPKKSGQASVGQAGAADSQVEKMLQHVRHMPEHRFDLIADDMIERYIDRLERMNGVLTDKEKTTERYRVSELLYQVREMSDLEYEMRKSSIIEQFKSQFEKAEPKQRKRKGEPGKVGRFLLDTSLLPLLEKKLRYSELAKSSD